MEKKVNAAQNLGVPRSESKATSVLNVAPSDCDTCKIKIEEGERRRYASVHPAGFWTDVVKVNQSKSWEDGTWSEIEISWSAGGTDGSLSGIGLADSFIHALNHAKNIAEGWTDTPTPRPLEPRR